MRFRHGHSHSFDFDTAIREATADFGVPDVIIFGCVLPDFRKAAALFGSLFPDSTVLGSTSFSFFGDDCCDDMTICAAALYDCVCFGGVIRDIGRFPKKYADVIRSAADSVLSDSAKGDTVCFEFTTAPQLAEELVQDTFSSVLKDTGIRVVGGTAPYIGEKKESLVCFGGEVFDDGCAFVMIKNTGGRIGIYESYVFRPTARTLTATKVDVERRIVYEYDHKPAAVALADAYRISLDEFKDSVSKYPIGVFSGSTFHICDTSEIMPDGAIAYFSRIYGSTKIHLLTVDGSPRKNLFEQMDVITRDMPQRKFSIVINCVSRDKISRANGFEEKSRRIITDALGSYIYLSTLGEQINGIHANQTMITTVFD